MASELANYGELLCDIKNRIRKAQTRAVLAANAELVRLYWDIGRLIGQRQSEEGWGAGIIPRLSRDLHNEMPELKEFSERNLKLMVQFAQEYPAAFGANSIAQPPVAQLSLPESAVHAVAELSAGSIAKQSAAQFEDKAIGQPVVARLPSTQNDGAIAALIPWAHNVLLMQRVKDRPTGDWYMQQTLAHGWSRNILAMQIQS